MLLAVAIVKAQLSSTLCGVNILLAVLNTCFAHEINDHDKLKLSHKALQKQTLGLTNEYNRVTDKGAQQELREDRAEDLRQRVRELEVRCHILNVNRQRCVDPFSRHQTNILSHHAKGCSFVIVKVQGRRMTKNTKQKLWLSLCSILLELSFEQCLDRECIELVG
jgi:hypothetical protein